MFCRQSDYIVGKYDSSFALQSDKWIRNRFSFSKLTIIFFFDHFNRIGYVRVYKMLKCFQTVYINQLHIIYIHFTLSLNIYRLFLFCTFFIKVSCIYNFITLILLQYTELCVLYIFKEISISSFFLLLIIYNFIIKFKF